MWGVTEKVARIFIAPELNFPKPYMALSQEVSLAPCLKSVDSTHLCFCDYS